MPCKSQKIRMDWVLLTTDTTTEVFIPAGPWMATAGVSGARCSLELRQKSGDFRATIAVQFANDPRSPDSGINDVGIASGDAGFANADGVFDPATTLTTLTSTGFELMRVGWAVKLSSAGSRAYGRIGGVLELFYD